MTHNLLLLALSFGGPEGVSPPPQAPPVQAPAVKTPTVGEKPRGSTRHEVVATEAPRRSALSAATPVTTVVPSPPAYHLVRFTDGVWRWVPAQPTPLPGPGVPVSRPFRYDNRYDPDHRCDVCGATQYVVSGWNRDGTHSHRCPRCGNTWRH